MRAALQRNFDPAVDFLVRRPDAEETLMPTLAAGALWGWRTLALGASKGCSASHCTSLKLRETLFLLRKPRLKLGDPLRLPQHQLDKGCFIERINLGAIHSNRESRRPHLGKAKLQKGAKQILCEDVPRPGVRRAKRAYRL